MEEQHSLEWFRKRLGKITGSMVGVLMKKGRCEDFSETAKSYIYQLAAERSMNVEIVEDDDLFQQYLYQVDVSSKAMKWGNEQEQYARSLYSKITGRCVSETGSCLHPTIPLFASSPDGVFMDNTTGEKGAIEIKCPNQSTFMKYKDEVKDNETLLKTKPEYFYQCMAHMMCTGSEWVDFIAYCPFQSVPIHIARILPDEKVFTEMEKRIRIANDIINQIADV